MYIKTIHGNDYRSPRKVNEGMVRLKGGQMSVDVYTSIG
jgi:hypothetical protein